MKSIAAILATAAVVLLVTGCGASGPSSSGVATLPSPSAGSAGVARTAPPLASGGQTAQALAYAQCVRAHGVPNWPDPNGSGGFDKTKLTSQHLGVSDSLLQAAGTACRPLLTSGGSGSRGPDPAEVQQALMFSGCMRRHGMSNFPDPDGSGRIPDPASLGIDQGAPRFEAANQACGAYRPPYMPSNAQYNTFASSQP
jgi:hypothetical protein